MGFIRKRRVCSEHDDAFGTRFRLASMQKKTASCWRSGLRGYNRYMIEAMIPGELTMNIGVIGGDSDGIWFHFDIRHPVTLDAEATARRMQQIFSANGWQLPRPV